MKYIKGSGGFTVLETILIAALVAAIAIVGTYALTQRQSQNDPANKTVASSSSKTVQYSAAKAESQALAFYKAYIGAAAGEPNPTATKAVLKQYTTTSFGQFYDEPRQYDPVVCGQDLPDGLAVKTTGSKLEGGGATVTVVMNFMGSGDNTVYAKVDKDYKINEVVCPNLQ